MFAASGARTRSTSSPARPGSPRSSSGAAGSSPRSTRPATPRSSPAATSRPTRDRVDRDALADALGAPRRARRPRRATSPRRSASRPATSGRRTASGSTRSGTRSTPTTRDSPLFPVLLTSLIEAADRVDSTVGVQMAYLKQWAPRAQQPPDPAGARAARRPGRRGARRRGRRWSATLGSFDLAYLDPPYNQHRYFTNYHVWETLVAWDAPEHYGIACKRIDARDDATKSAFNRKREMPAALRACIEAVDARAGDPLLQRRELDRARRAASSMCAAAR